MAHFSGQSARDSARQHNGNVYHYNYYHETAKENAKLQSSTAKTEQEHRARPASSQIELDEQLSQAVKRGQHTRVSYLLQQGASANALVSPNSMRTLLYAAVAAEQSKIAKALIEAGADVNRPCRGARTPLHQAVQSRSRLTAEALIQAGADVDAQDEHGNTALHVAAFTYGGENMLKALLRAGADIHSSTAEGETALHRAAQTDSVRIIDDLIKAGSDVNAVDRHGRSVLTAAISVASMVAVKLLLTAGADASVLEEGETRLGFAERMLKKTSDLYRLHSSDKYYDSRQRAKGIVALLEEHQRACQDADRRHAVASANSSTECLVSGWVPHTMLDLQDV